MSESNIDIKLTPSDRMNEGSDNENSYIRIPKRARNSLAPKTEKIVLTYKKKTVALEIRNAFKEDVAELKSNIGSGETSREDSLRTGFVTSQTLQRLMGRGKQAQEKYCYVSEDIEDIMLGADPEFALVDPSTGSYKYAAHVNGFGEIGLLGSDGPLAEVRPPPDNSTAGVIANITKILKKGNPHISVYDWIAGATYRNPNDKKERVLHIGGHIHLGDPLILPSKNKQGIYRQVIRMLDELMAIPLVRIDGPHAPLRRNTTHTNGFGRYGQWGDTRPQVGRFEWRVPSGLWMCHPDFARAVLGTSKAVTETCYQMMSEKGFDPEWVNARSEEAGFLKEWSAMGASKAADIVNKSEARLVTAALIKRSETKLKRMDNYSKYKEDIDEFLSLVKLSSKDRKNINLNIKDTWLNGGSLIKERK